MTLGPSEYPSGYSDFLLPICKFSYVVAQKCATFVAWGSCMQKDLFLTTYRRFHVTEENYNYRTSQTLLRNQFPGKGKLKIPIIPKFQESPGDFDDLFLDVADIGGVVLHAVQCILNVRTVQFQKPEFDHLSRIAVSGNADRLPAGTDSIQHELHQLIQTVMAQAHALVLYECHTRCSPK